MAFYFIYCIRIHIEIHTRECCTFFRCHSFMDQRTREIKFVQLKMIVLYCGIQSTVSI